jgi:plastocyanin
MSVGLNYIAMKTTLIVLIILVLIGGIAYAYMRNSPDQDAVVCTMDAKLCPDGTYVGRIGPNCEFALCPGATSSTEAATSTGILDSITNASSSITATTSVKLATSTTITYTANGFTPSSVIVAKGAKVTFVNNSNAGMWVASDPHPTHNGYPDFDAEKAISNGGSYSFTFDKEGSWGYHNHLNPTNKGTIIVQ